MVDSDKQPGPAVDKTGDSAIDPTKNVRELVEAAIKRQDDLRLGFDRRQDDLRQGAERLSLCKHAHIKEMAELRARHARDLNDAETKRIDAIRSVDVGAVAIATERATAAATVLANQVTQSAETLRALVASTATASTAQSTASFNQLSDRITLLERGSYEGVGKSAVADPMMAKMIQTLEQMQLNMAKGAGREGLSTPLLMTIAAAGTGLVVFMIQTALT